MMRLLFPKPRTTTATPAGPLPLSARPAAYALLFTLLTAAAACAGDDDDDAYAGVDGSFGVFAIDGHAYETYAFADNVVDRREDFVKFNATTVGPDFNGEVVPPLPPDHDYSAYHPYAFSIGGAVDYTAAREYEVVSLFRGSDSLRLRRSELQADTVVVSFSHWNGHHDAIYDRFYTDTAAAAVQHFSVVPTARGDSVDVSARLQMLRYDYGQPPPGTAWDLPPRFELVVETVRIAVPPPRRPQ